MFSNKDLESSWRDYLGEEFKKEYMIDLVNFLNSENNKGKVIYPQAQDIFSAFEQTAFDKVKVVIIGQDPYHGDGQAHGLSFSVKPGIKIPPSLANIYKEIKNDLGHEMPNHGYLMNWAKQGVLLLNTVLTVEQANAGSHRKKGWEYFTDKVIELLNTEKKNLVFILWGAPAQKKGAKIDTTKHLVLKSAHPSPLSAYRGFFDNHHFSKTNTYLVKHQIEPIDWHRLQ